MWLRICIFILKPITSRSVLLTKLWMSGIWCSVSYAGLGHELTETIKIHNTKLHNLYTHKMLLGS